MYKDNYVERRNKRVPVTLGVGAAIHKRRFGFPPRRPEFCGKGWVSKASMAGLDVVFEQPVSEGAVLSMWISIANDTSVRLRGDVIWSKPGETEGSYLVGIRLRDRPKAQMQKWTDFIAQRIRRHEQ